MGGRIWVNEAGIMVEKSCQYLVFFMPWSFRGRKAEELVLTFPSERRCFITQRVLAQGTSKIDFLPNHPSPRSHLYEGEVEEAGERGPCESCQHVG